MELVSEAVNFVSPMRQLGLFFTERQSHSVELFPHFVLSGLGFSCLSLDHHNDVVGIAGISSFAWVFLVLRVAGCPSLWPFHPHEFCDECLSWGPLGLFELA